MEPKLFQYQTSAFLKKNKVTIFIHCTVIDHVDHDNIVTSDSDISDNELTGPSR